MKSMRVIARVPAAVCLLVAALAWGQGGNGQEQVKKVTDQLLAALLKADTNSLDKFLADDFTAIRGDGTLSTNAQEIANLKSGALKYETVDVHDLKIRVYGDTAVVTSLVFFKGTINGKPVSSDVRNTRVWLKQKGNWKCVASQATRIPASQ